MLLMGLASNRFSPNDDHDGDEAAWQAALHPPRLYEAVLAENQRGPGPRPIWEGVVQEVVDLLNWAAETRSLQGGDRLLFQTADSQWHWNQSAASEYDVMHAWAVEGGIIKPDENEQTGTDGVSGGDGGREGEQNDGDGGEQVTAEIRQALMDAADLCDTGQEERLCYALVLVEGPRRRIRDDIWNWGH